jgi:hypothetical protein
MNFKAQIPAVQHTSFSARHLAAGIKKSMNVLVEIDADFHFDALISKIAALKGAAGAVEFDVLIDNNFLSEEEVPDLIQEITESLPASIELI